MTSEVVRAISWSKCLETRRACKGYHSGQHKYFCREDATRRLTEIGPICIEHYLREPACDVCGMPVEDRPNARYNWPGLGPGAARKGVRGTPAKRGARLCRACSCYDDPEILAAERERAMSSRSNFPAMDECPVQSF